MADTIGKKEADKLREEQTEYKKKMEKNEQKLLQYDNAHIIEHLQTILKTLDDPNGSKVFSTLTKELCRKVNRKINPAKKKKAKGEEGDKATANKKKATRIEEFALSASNILKSQPDKEFKRGELEASLFEDPESHTFHAGEWKDFKTDNPDIIVRGEKAGQTVQWKGKS